MIDAIAALSREQLIALLTIYAKDFSGALRAVVPVD